MDCRHISNVGREGEGGTKNMALSTTVLPMHFKKFYCRGLRMQVSVLIPFCVLGEGEGF